MRALFFAFSPFSLALGPLPFALAPPVPLALVHEGHEPFAQELGVFARLDGHDALHHDLTAEHLLLIPGDEVRRDGVEDYMGQKRAVEGGDQCHRHVGAQRFHVRAIQAFEHVDQADQGTDHTKGGRGVGSPLVHGHDLLMAGGGLFDVVLQDAAHPVGVVGIHNEHVRLFEEGVRLIVGLFLQGQQTVLSRDLGQFHQLLHIGRRIKGLGAEHDLDVAGDGPGQLRITGDHHGQRAAQHDEDTGNVHKVPHACRRETEIEHGRLAGVDADADHNAEDGECNS